MSGAADDDRGSILFLLYAVGGRKNSSNVGDGCILLLFIRGKRSLRRIPMIKMELVQPECKFDDIASVMDR